VTWAVTEARSAIEWTDATWNPVRGCTKASPGCKFCYAEQFSERFRGVPGHPFERGFDLRLVPFVLKQWGGTRKHETGPTLDGRTYDEFPLAFHRVFLLLRSSE
jgi:protein gp37